MWEGTSQKAPKDRLPGARKAAAGSSYSSWRPREVVPPGWKLDAGYAGSEILLLRQGNSKPICL